MFHIQVRERHRIMSYPIEYSSIAIAINNARVMHKALSKNNPGKIVRIDVVGEHGTSFWSAYLLNTPCEELTTCYVDCDPEYLELNLPEKAHKYLKINPSLPTKAEPVYHRRFQQWPDDPLRKLRRNNLPENRT